MHVSVALVGGVLELSVRDDGVGGAKLGAGTGLIGLIDRVEALGGRIRVTSPAWRRDRAAGSADQSADAGCPPAAAEGRRTALPST